VPRTSNVDRQSEMIWLALSILGAVCIVGWYRWAA
jgi:hypothetical protein